MWSDCFSKALLSVTKFGLTYHYRVGKAFSTPGLKLGMQSAADSCRLLLHFNILRRICSCFPMNGNGTCLNQVARWQASHNPPASAFRIHT